MRHRLYYEFPAQELAPIFAQAGIDIPISDLRHDESLHIQHEGWDIDLCGGIGRIKLCLTAPEVVL